MSVDAAIRVRRAPSQPDTQVFTDMHFYLQGAEGDEVCRHRSLATSIIVKKNESIINESVTAIVTSMPGRYAVSVSLTATVAGTGKTRVNETIPVIVR